MGAGRALCLCVAQEGPIAELGSVTIALTQCDDAARGDGSSTALSLSIVLFQLPSRLASKKLWNTLVRAASV